MSQSSCDEVDRLLGEIERIARFENVEDRHLLDERVATVNTAFVNLVGVNEGLLEFCPNNEPPSQDECLAWLWVLRPRLSHQLLERTSLRQFRVLASAYQARYGRPT